MAVKQVKFNDTYIYINDEVDYKETGIRLNKDGDSEKTKVIEPIVIEDPLENTQVNIGENADE